MKEMKFFRRGGKFVMGMIHCLPLPGTAFYNGDMQAIIDQALLDADNLVRAGVDAVIVENMGDGPFGVTMDTAQVAALAAVSALIAERVKLPIGIDAAMNDCEAALSIAKAVGAEFVRIPVFVDTVEFYGGIISPCARKAMLFRKSIGAEDIKILADIHVKHTHMLLTHVKIEDSARAAEENGADGIIVTGTHIGTETPLELIERVKKVTSVPIIAGSGVKTENINKQFEIADGAIVGSSLKEGGKIENPISYELTRALVQTIKR
ncbi:MAG: BtpA/SgcQ family protein [Clostridia bacterium]